MHGYHLSESSRIAWFEATRNQNQSCQSGEHIELVQPLYRRHPYIQSMEMSPIYSSFFPECSTLTYASLDAISSTSNPIRRFICDASPMNVLSRALALSDKNLDYRDYIENTHTLETGRRLHHCGTLTLCKYLSSATPYPAALAMQPAVKSLQSFTWTGEK